MQSPRGTGEGVRSIEQQLSTASLAFTVELLNGELGWPLRSFT